jgi:hypothetical protein
MMITADPLPIPGYWARINGLDFGWDYPFAAVSLAHDRDSDCVYVTNFYRERRSTLVIHVAAVKPWGAWIPCAWPHDGLQHDNARKGSICFKTARDSRMAVPVWSSSVIKMLDRMQTARFKVFRNLSDWFAEKRHYHRKDGKIVKDRDDLPSATRYGLMMLRFAENPLLPRRSQPAMPVSPWAA